MGEAEAAGSDADVIQGEPQGWAGTSEETETACSEMGKMWRDRLGVFQEFHVEIPLRASHPIFGKRMESRNLNSYLHTHTRSSIIHHHQEMEATQVFIDG